MLKLEAYFFGYLGWPMGLVGFLAVLLEVGTLEELN